jgi:hypothetical protein
LARPSRCSEESVSAASQCINVSRIFGKLMKWGSAPKVPLRGILKRQNSWKGHPKKSITCKSQQRHILKNFDEREHRAHLTPCGSRNCSRGQNAAPSSGMQQNAQESRFTSLAHDRRLPRFSCLFPFFSFHGLASSGRNRDHNAQ